MKCFPYGVVGPSKILDIADSILDEFFQIAGRLEIKACLAFGLCLGFVRDGGYIDGDNDLDVVVVIPSEEVKMTLVNELIKCGFKQGESYPMPSYNVHFYKNEILLDIYFRQQGKFYLNFDTVKYNDKTYPVPHPVEEYLGACYSNWKVKEEQETRYYD